MNRLFKHDTIRSYREAAWLGMNRAAHARKHGEYNEARRHLAVSKRFSVRAETGIWDITAALVEINLRENDRRIAEALGARR